MRNETAFPSIADAIGITALTVGICLFGILAGTHIAAPGPTVSLNHTLQVFVRDAETNQPLEEAYVTVRAGLKLHPSKNHNDEEVIAGELTDASGSACLGVFLVDELTVDASHPHVTPIRYKQCTRPMKFPAVGSERAPSLCVIYLERE